MYDPLASITSVATTTTSRKSNKHQLKKHKVHSDLQLGPKRHWTEQQNLVMSRRFHEEMLSNAHSHIAKELNAHEKRLKIAATLFDQSTAQENARRFRQKKTSEENKRLLKRLLKIEMQETEITKTNAPGCAEKVRFRRQRKARRKALRASKQHKVSYAVTIITTSKRIESVSFFFSLSNYRSTNISFNLTLFFSSCSSCFFLFLLVSSCFFLFLLVSSCSFVSLTKSIVKMV